MTIPLTRYNLNYSETPKILEAIELTEPWRCKAAQNKLCPENFNILNENKTGLELGKVLKSPQGPMLARIGPIIG